MNTEFLILDFLQENLRSVPMDKLMVFITSLGNGGFIWIVICLFMLMTKKFRKTGVAMAFGLVLSMILGNRILKPLVARPRPSWLNDEIILLIKNPTDFSFPSGHTFSSFVSAYIVTHYHKKARFLIIPLAAAIAFSRLYLYVHFPTDVLFGAVLGCAVGYISIKIADRIYKKAF